MFTIEPPRMISIYGARTPTSFEHVVLVFSNPYLSIYHSNKGAQIIAIIASKRGVYLALF